MESITRCKAQNAKVRTAIKIIVIFFFLNKFLDHYRFIKYPSSCLTKFLNVVVRMACADTIDFNTFCLMSHRISNFNTFLMPAKWNNS